VNVPDAAKSIAKRLSRLPRGCARPIRTGHRPPVQPAMWLPSTPCCQYRSRIFGIIYNLTSNREDAADLTQDVFIKAFQSIHRFQARHRFSRGFTGSHQLGADPPEKERIRSFFSLESIDQEPCFA